jgi:RNA-directed DNA polymerase
VDANLMSYFDTIPHDQLMAQIGESISDGRVLDVLRGWLQQDILHDSRRWTPTGGTPQGAVTSPLLANLYLHPLDRHLMERGYRSVRYADDFVILCRSAAEARAALQEVQCWIEAHGLQLHPDKTHLGDCRQPGQGFEFLGYRFEVGKRWVRDKSLKRFKSNIRERTRRTSGKSLERLIADLNPLLRGWFGYFKQAHPFTFERLDRFIRRRLCAVLRKQSKRPGHGRCRADHQRWPNASSLLPGCSHFIPPGRRRETPDEVTANWRAVCGRTARTVRREGRRKPSLPLSGGCVILIDQRERRISDYGQGVSLCCGPGWWR